MDFNIKKVVNRVYDLDYTNREVKNGEEFMITNGVCEFVNSFTYQNNKNGIMMFPSGYTGRGLFYRDGENGEIYSPAHLEPINVDFSFNFTGLKADTFYRVTVIAKNHSDDVRRTTDRSIRITDNTKYKVLDTDFTDHFDFMEAHGIFKTTNNKLSLNFKIGKVVISRIMIDEVELVTAYENEKEEEVVEVGKLQLLSYGVFDLTDLSTSEKTNRYIMTTKLSGRGINLYYDTHENTYVLERDNVHDIINDNFNNYPYVIDIHDSSLVYGGKFVCSDIGITQSPNTLKQGFLKYKLKDMSNNDIDGSKLKGKLIITIHKIY